MEPSREIHIQLVSCHLGECVGVMRSLLCMDNGLAKRVVASDKSLYCSGIIDNEIHSAVNRTGYACASF